MNTFTANASGRILPNAATGIVFLIVAMSLALLLRVDEAQARDRSRQDAGRSGAVNMEGVSIWLRDRFSDTELAALRPEDFRMESHACSCYDRPNPHFPYLLVLFTTPKGDLVGRPDRRGVDLTITRLAVRHGEQYCDVDAEDQCYGSFAHPCEFTDFRYGPYLAEYFPTCKAIEDELELTPVSTEILPLR